jgi:hypothetical protein
MMSTQLLGGCSQRRLERGRQLKDMQCQSRRSGGAVIVRVASVVRGGASDHGIVSWNLSALTGDSGKILERRPARGRLRPAK